MIEYESKNAQPFLKLMDNESKGFINELKEFSKNRLSGLESAYSKLQKNIETIYNDSFVNYYLNLESNNKNSMNKYMLRGHPRKPKEENRANSVQWGQGQARPRN